MIKNYFYLNRFVIEAADILSGKKVYHIFTQEKDKLILVFGNEYEEQYLEMYVNPGQPHINIREHYSRARKNTINLFTNAYGQNIRSIKIADDDRIIKIELEIASLYFTIRGKYTNVYFKTVSSNIIPFKKIDDRALTELGDEFKRKNYLDCLNKLNPEIESDDYFSAVKKKYPVIGNEIIKEAKRRVKSEEDDKKEILREVIEEIFIEQPCVLINEDTAEVHLAPVTFDIFGYTEKKQFDSLIDAQTFYLSKKRFISEKHRLLKLIIRHIEKELKKLSNKINNLSAVVEKGSKEEEYKQLGNLLLVNIGKIKPGMESIEVEDIYGSNEKIKIKLNPKLPPKKNIDYYFDKSKAEKISVQKSKELLTQAKAKFKELKEIEANLKSIDDLKELKGLMKKMKIKDKDYNQAKEELKIKFKHYLIDDKYNVYVGRDSKNNDLLTTKFAKQNDYWFHARSVSGSHVVLRVENTKEPVPKSVLKKAAALAAYHSKAKTAGVVPVAYTLKKYVVKKKGFPAGTVHLLREDVLLVKPEIPKGCEFVTDE